MRHHMGRVGPKSVNLSAQYKTGMTEPEKGPLAVQNTPSIRDRARPVKGGLGRAGVWLDISVRGPV
jgi:hypothetical protein